MPIRFHFTRRIRVRRVHSRIKTLSNLAMIASVSQGCMTLHASRCGLLVGFVYNIRDRKLTRVVQRQKEGVYRPRHKQLGATARAVLDTREQSYHLRAATLIKGEARQASTRNKRGRLIFHCTKRLRAAYLTDLCYFRAVLIKPTTNHLLTARLARS